jgi:hypothetical protein
VLRLPALALESLAQARQPARCHRQADAAPPLLTLSTGELVRLG